jgi:hypothetical protein
MTTETMTQDEAEVRRLCDRLVTTCAEMAVEGGASVPMLLDRMLTYAAAQAVVIDGSRNTAEVFRTLATTIEDGVFAHLDPDRKGKSH